MAPSPHPWTVAERGPNSGIVIRDANGMRIATVWTGNSLAADNARLMAAAPRLLKALQAMVNECTGLPSHPHLANYVSHKPEHWQEASAAIAEATGTEG